jgi:hypothetical protein
VTEIIHDNHILFRLGKLSSFVNENLFTSLFFRHIFFINFDKSNLSRQLKKIVQFLRIEQ